MASNQIPGKRLIPTVIDDFAENNPAKIYASVPVNDLDLTKGFQEITFKQLSNAINAASWWLESILAKSQKFETFAYFGPRDLRYPILIAAAAKVRKRILLPSLFASQDAYLALINAMDCGVIIHSPEQEALARTLQNRLPHIKCITVPSLDEWLHSPVPVPHYPFTASFDDVEHDPVFIVHTSGTTGLPKPVVYTHGHMATFDACSTLPNINGTPPFVAKLFDDSHRFYCSLPIFHVVGIIFALVVPAFSRTVLVLGPALGAPSPEATKAILDHANVDCGVFPPFLIEAIAREPKTWEKLKKLKLVCFGGAPLSPEIGNELSQVTTLWSGMGTTEGGGIPTLEVKNEDWQYLHYHPAVGATFEKQGDHDLYELIFNRIPENNLAHNIFRTFPDLQTYRSKDLYLPHPTNPDLWRYSGRTDDLVALTGEIKLYARGIEEAVHQHPAIKGVLVGGDGRIEPFMLIELADNNAIDTAVSHDIWNLVETVNQRNAEAAMIRRDMIIFVDTPFSRTAKGTIDRRTTFQTIEKAIDELYLGCN